MLYEVITLPACATLSARFRCYAFFAVEGFGQYSRDRRLAHAPGAGEQVGVVQPAARQRVAQRLHDVRLADHLREAARTVLAGEDDA